MKYPNVDTNVKVTEMVNHILGDLTGFVQHHKVHLDVQDKIDSMRALTPHAHIPHANISRTTSTLSFSSEHQKNVDAAMSISYTQSSPTLEHDCDTKEAAYALLEL